MHKAWRDEIWLSNIDIRRGWVTYVLSLRTNGKFIASPGTPFINMVYFCSYRKIVTIPGRTLDKNKVVRNYMKNKLFWITQLVACYYNFSSTPIPFSVYGDDFKMLWNITVTKVRKRMQSDNFRLHQSLGDDFKKLSNITVTKLENKYVFWQFSSTPIPFSMYGNEFKMLKS